MTAEERPDALLSRGLAALGRSLPFEQRERLCALALLVERWADRINLTGHRSADAAMRGLVLEAIALEAVLPAAATLLDLGSGAGFPGLPVAILRTDARVTLLDARQRRHHFQRHAVRTLDLANVTPLLGRAERLVPDPHDLVVAQALARPGTALELMLPWARSGGKLALAVSPDAALPRDADLEELGDIEIQHYTVPVSRRARALWVACRR